MRIKPPSAKNRKIAALKLKHRHWWLLQEKPKTTARLSSLNKANKKLRRLIGPSEFVTMAIKLEDEAGTKQKRY